MSRQRLEPDVRKEQILATAITLAEKGNYTTITRLDIANKIGCSEGIVSWYFHTMKKLKRAVMREAVHTDNLIVIAQGLIAKDKQAHKADDKIKKKALASIL